MAVRNIRKQLAGVEDLLLGKGKQDQERSAGIVSITKIDIPAIVETIDELSLVNINKYTTAIVKDINNGGTFIYIASNLAINNGITIFNGWTRQAEIPAIVETIDDLSTVDITKYSTVIVKDIDRGGTFIYIDSNLAINNGGTIFNGWTRQYSGAANVKWFGAQDDVAPTSGTWPKGVIAWNSDPSAGGFIGWVCVASGTPGTWKTFGAISA